MKKLLLIVGIAAMSFSTVATGCVVTARPARVNYSYAGWHPYYYNGYLVYFDNYGRPYYYSSGVRVYVPSTWANYRVAVRYYRVHRYNYLRWHRRYHRPTYFRYRRRSVRRRYRRRRVVRRRPVRRVRVRRRRVRRPHGSVRVRF